MAVHLSQIVPWGRTRREYERMFSLSGADLCGSVLDCGGGPASFTAEVCSRGCRATAVDPLYLHPAAEIRSRFEATADSVLAQMRATPQDWTWTFHRDPEALLTERRFALKTFLADYEQGLREGRYVVGELPSLPFDNDSFGVAVCSHLLFLYSDLLTLDFHLRSVRELCRVAREVRVFPLLSLRCQPSPHLPSVVASLEAEGYSVQVLRVDYELQRGGNEMLRVFKPR